MRYGNRLALVLPAAVALLFAVAAASQQPAAPARAPATAQIRSLDRALAQLPASRTMRFVPPPVRPTAAVEATPSADAAAPAAPATAPAPAPGPASAIQHTATSPATLRPALNTLQYVRTPPALERRVAASLAAQPAIRNAITASGANPGALVPLPGILRQSEASGESVQLKAFAVRGQPLIYDAARHSYSGTIILGVTEIVPGRPQRMLNVPVVFQVLNADRADPAEIRFDRTSPPFQVVHLTLAAARPVQVLSDAIPDGGVDIQLQLSPVLAIEAGHGAIEGLGLEATEVNIQLTGIEQPRGRVVILHTDSGYLDRTRVTLDEQGLASVMLRSDDVGTAHITAATTGVEPARTDVNFRLPFITFLASIVGGLAGGFLRPQARRRLTTMLAACVCGVIIFALYTIGINVLPYTPTVTVGAAFVFAISALGGFWGPKLLHR